MACTDNATFTVKSIQAIAESFNGSFAAYSQQNMDSIGPLILGALGGDCVGAKQFLIDNFLVAPGNPLYPFGQFPGGYAITKTGTVIPRPTPNDLTPNPPCTAENNTCLLNITINNVLVGSVGWLFDAVTLAPKPYDELSWPGVTMGVNCDSILFDTTISDTSGRLEWNVNTPQLTLFDLNSWWCCVNPICCGAPSAAKTGYLIPRPENPEIGDENISTPPLELPLYLSNFTAQFTNNFGRVKKI